MINASITGMSLLTQQGAQSWHPASEKLKTAAEEAAKLSSVCRIENLTFLHRKYYSAVYKLLLMHRLFKVLSICIVNSSYCI